MSNEHQAGHERLIRRRDFLIGGVKVGISFLALDALNFSTFAQQSAAAKTARLPLDKISLTEPPEIDDSLKVVAAYLVQYAPPTQNFPASGAWRASYDLIEWEGSPRASKKTEFFRRNRVAGTMNVTRRPESARAGVSYDFDNDIRMNGFASLLKSTMHCSADPLPGLLDWETDYEMRSMNKPGAPATLTEQGRHKDGVLEITNSSGTRHIKTDRPVAPQWAVMDALRGVKATPSDPMAGVEFDLFHDLTSYRPHQRLAPCGVLDLSLDGKSYTLHGFIQTGIGTVPTHYWIDADGRPLLGTAGLLSIALTSIQA